MKKYLLILVLLLASLFCEAQIQEKLILRDVSTFFYVPDANTAPQLNITPYQIFGGNGWAQIGASCAGCPSIFYKIQRSLNSFIAEDGREYYYFFFYFYSNSFYPNGNPASSYLTNISFFMNGSFIFNAEYILVSPGIVTYVAWLRSGNPNSPVLFQIAQINVY